MNKMKVLWGVGTLCLFLAMAGCTLTPRLEGSPIEAGLLVVDPYALLKGYEGSDGARPVTNVALRRRDDGALMKPIAVADVFVYSDLTPGIYEVTTFTVELKDRELDIPVPLGQRGEFAFDVTAGQVIYPGTITAEAVFDFPTPATMTFVLRHSVRRERDLLYYLRSLYPDSQWAPRITAHLNALR